MYVILKFHLPLLVCLSRDNSDITNLNPAGQVMMVVVVFSLTDRWSSTVSLFYWTSANRGAALSSGESAPAELGQVKSVRLCLSRMKQQEETTQSLSKEETARWVHERVVHCLLQLYLCPRVTNIPLHVCCCAPFMLRCDVSRITCSLKQTICVEMLQEGFHRWRPSNGSRNSVTQLLLI